jgi:purine/pyrimidine-nucleoside phosphorylase
MLKVNEYFDGKVKSINLQTATLPATVGVMAQGELAVLYPNETEWQSFVEGQSFDVAGDSSFKVKAVVESAYLCKFWR